MVGKRLGLLVGAAALALGLSAAPSAAHAAVVPPMNGGCVATNFGGGLCFLVNNEDWAFTEVTAGAATEHVEVAYWGASFSWGWQAYTWITLYPGQRWSNVRPIKRVSGADCAGVIVNNQLNDVCQFVA